ncbi:MAG: glycoside hydrolase family 127 protein [Clostridia bacterium]|nr:glycoside hydrolase family 127 protein [Clostridia bacterium]
MKEIFKNAKYSGFVQSAFEFVEKEQLLREDLWERFVQQFREDADYEGGWRGEYWGKMMRGACLVYQYTKNEKLYSVLCKTVCDMIESADEKGRISSYAANHEFEAWDMWCRKYVLLGMEYFLEICKDEKFAADVIKSMRGQLDYIIERIGRGEGKKEITAATRHWRGLNSSSILEPVVKLYNLTGEQKYFDFAKYIVDIGCIDIANIFELAYENKFYPYQYPVTKAYEMTSCFEGLIEFYKITGEEKYKTAIVNFADKVLESDFTVIGCCGCTHELFDHSTVRQANTTNEEIMQETCVTVTLMKFFYRVHLLTGDPKYVDAFEISLYNAYLGSFNTEGVIEPMIKREHPDWTAEPLPFDSYSPLTAGRRGNGIGGLKCMSDNHYYGCCACIGSAGIGLVPQMQILKSDSGIVLNLYINGKTTTDDGITLNIDTEYPKYGTVKVSVETADVKKFELALRNPSWSKSTKTAVNGEPVQATDGYIKIDRKWKNGDTVELEFDMSTEVIYPIPYGTDILMNNVVWGYNYIVPNYDEEDPLAKNHIALRRGPVMLAMENRLGYSVDDAIDVKIENGFVDAKLTDKEIPFDAIVKAEIPLTDGKTITVTDYASAGKLWTDESKMAVWLLTK